MNHLRIAQTCLIGMLVAAPARAQFETGACCFADGTCQVMSSVTCSLQGSYQGDGTTCNQVECAGACCRPDGTCFETGAILCNIAGEFRGQGSDCADVACSGACCLPNGSCQDSSDTACAQSGGVHYGDQTECATFDCLGACCLPDGTCVDDVEANCTDGLFNGPGTRCADYDCPEPMPTAFTYQGRLVHAGVPVDGPVDLEFSLWVGPDGQPQVGPTLLMQNVLVRDGLFTVELDFGADVFNGDARWLQIALCDACGGNFTVLAPRQSLTPTPYALHARSAEKLIDTLFLEGGNVGINTATPASRLHVSGGTGSVNMLLEADTNNAGEGDQPSITMSQDGGLVTADLGFLDALNHLTIRTEDTTAGLSHLLLDPEGSVGIGTVSPAGAFKLDVAGNIRCVALTETSSRSLKENIAPIEGALEKVRRLQGVRFEWAAAHGDRPDLGFVAEDVAEVLPELVTWQPDGATAAGLKYGHLTAVTVEAIKEQQVMLDETRRQLTEKEAQIADLSARLERMEDVVRALAADD